MGVNNMNKKRTIIGCVLLFMLVALPFVSAVTQNTDVEKKDSPLYRIRTRFAINEKISNIVEKIKTKFLGERMFFLPATLRNRFSRTSSGMASSLGDNTCYYCTAFVVQETCGMLAFWCK